MREEAVKSPVDGTVCLPKFALLHIFYGTMTDIKSFISSIILYIKGHEPEFHSVKTKIMFALSYIHRDWHE